MKETKWRKWNEENYKENKPVKYLFLQMGNKMKVRKIKSFYFLYAYFILNKSGIPSKW